MPDEVIGAVAEGAVGNLLDVTWTVLPVTEAGEGFHLHQGPRVNVGCRSGLFHNPGLPSLPEFASGNVQRALGPERIDGDLVQRPAGTAGLGDQLQPVI